MPEFAELANLENWVHLNPYLLKVYSLRVSWEGPTTMSILPCRRNKRKNCKPSGQKTIPK